MTYAYDLAVFIARAEPLHLGHCAVIDTALQHAQRLVVLVGSSFTPRTYRNPFLFEEREQMILGTYADQRDRITVMPLEDCIYNDGTWVQNVQACVADAIQETYPGRTDLRITLVGHSKDHSSFYLKLFPQWNSINVPGYESEEFVLNATSIRDFYFLMDPQKVREILGTTTATERTLPSFVRDFMLDFMMTDAYRDIRDEYEFIQKYKSAWAAAPYAPTFNTVDAVVVQSGHVLLVQRKSRPGRGLWALPGGFLNPGERILDGMLRELKEETRIKVPVPVLRGSIVAHETFDDPHRSARGRTITHAYLIHLQPDVKLPQVRGSDDAAVARWWPLADVKREMMFEDHMDIVQHFAAMI